MFFFYFQMTFNFKNTVSQFKRLIGRKFSDPVVAEEKRRQNCQLVERPGDSIGLKVSLTMKKLTYSILHLCVVKSELAVWYSIKLWTERVTSVFTFGLSKESEISFNI